MVHPEVGAVGAQLLGGYRQLDRLQEGVGSRARTRAGAGCPVAEGKESDLLHPVLNLPGTD